MINSSTLPDHPFTSQDALELGIDKHGLTELVANREIRRVLRNVYVRADLPDTLELRAACVALVVSPQAVVCDRTAAWLHGIDVLDYHEFDVIPPVEVWTLRGRNRVSRKGCRGGERDLLDRDIQVINGIRVTAPLRTALDLGCRLPRRQALAALDAFMRECGVTREEMLRELPRYFRRRGVVQLRQLVPLADPRSESSGESWTRLEIIDADLPTPEPQWWVYVDGRPVFRLDLAYAHARVCVEYDGREFHEGDEQQDHDEKRREWLRLRGWDVIIVTKDDFTAEARDRWIAELRAALRMSSWPLARPGARPN